MRIMPPKAKGKPDGLAGPGGMRDMVSERL